MTGSHSQAALAANREHNRKPSRPSGVCANRRFRAVCRGSFQRSMGEGGTAVNLLSVLSTIGVTGMQQRRKRL